MSIVDSYPLSPMQEGMLFQTLAAPDSGVDIEQLVITTEEQLDAALLSRAWQRLVDRHAILRTSFAWEGTRPLQRVHAAVEMPIQAVDLSDLAPRERERRIESYLEDDRRRALDLREPPLQRLVLFRQGGAGSVLVWTVHHILLDGHALVGLLDEAFADIEALRENRTLVFPSRPPFRDFITWLEGRDLAGARSFWAETLRGVAALTPFGFDRARTVGAPEGPTFATRQIALPAPLTSALNAQAERHGLTLNTMVQGAWAVLLARCGGVSDVVFGATRECRSGTIEKSRDVVGPFINTLPVRVRVAAEEPVRRVLSDLRALSLATRPFEHTPLVAVKAASQMPAGSPLFESLLVFARRRAADTLRQLRPAWRRRQVVAREQTGYPLTLAAYGGDRLEILAEFDRRRFADDAVERMLGHLRTLLESMAADLETPVGRLPVLTADERRTMLEDWNRRTARVPRRRCVHQLFEDWATRAPDVPAVVFEGRSLTYGDLNARANRVARCLRRLGTGPDALVGICMDRSLEMVVAMLGVLKAGGAYLPLDPSYPQSRLALLLEDARAPILLALASTQADFCPAGTRVLRLDTDPQIAREDAGDLTDLATPRNLAYVMYTSGSTGRPKGVMVEHRNVVAFLHSYRAMTATPGRRVGTSVATFSFDTSVEEIFACLCFGGTVHLIRPEHSTDVAAFARYLVAHGITTAYVLPDFLEGVAAQLRVCGHVLALRCLLTGLAPKRQRVLQSFRDLSADLVILNGYGPTEVTYGATAFAFEQASDPDADTPIGKPFPNYRVYLVDRQLEPVPVGVVGELVVGGPGVARGYLNQPGATAEKFVPDPFGGAPGGRLYRTGDLARYRPDGNLEFVGRLDNQIKIRGFRVEPGEIEAALARHPHVLRAAVMAREDRLGSKRLVAYLVPRPGLAISAPDVRAHAQACLPPHMVPACTVVLDRLPLMVNGKVDYQALPSPDATRPELASAFVEPRTDLERTIAGAWMDVLGIDRVGVDDDFFALGGHSLLAITLFNRLRGLLGAEFQLGDVLRHPTIAGLLRHLGLSGDALEPSEPDEARLVGALP